VMLPPMYLVGLHGMPRRIAEYAASTGWQDLNVAETVGAFLISAGVLVFAVNAYVSWRRPVVASANPWDANSLEWATSSPPPAYNFAILPRVETIDAFWTMKQRGLPAAAPAYDSIELPENSAIGIVTGFLATVTGFALIWHIWWLVLIGLAGAALALMSFGWPERPELEIPSAEIARIEEARLGLGRPA